MYPITNNDNKNDNTNKVKIRMINIKKNAWTKYLISIRYRDS